jgi:hypothetical protein
MKIKFILLSIFLLLLFLFFVILINQKYENYTEKEIQKEIKKIDKSKSIKNTPYTISTGLLIDSLIISNSINEKENEYDIYYEEYKKRNDPTDKNYKNSFIFVNLDITNFERLISDKLSPNNILCKTIHTYETLKNKIKNKNIIYTGFTSLDRHNPSVIKDYKSFIHNVGKSPYKGTKNVINVWRKNPDFPLLTIICRNKKILDNVEIKDNKNINLINKYLTEEELTYEINKNGIHICPSNHEGFGHYINEAMSAKSVVLYTNAVPMNEFYGIPIDINKNINAVTNNGWCPYYQVDENHLEKIVRNIMNNKYDLEEIGNNSRIHYIRNDLKFKNRIKNIFV